MKTLLLVGALLQSGAIAVPYNAPSVSVSVGNSNGVTTATQTGKGGIFANGGSIFDIFTSSGNIFKGSQSGTGSVEAGNSEKLQNQVKSGDGALFGTGGFVNGVSVASKNQASGSAGYTEAVVGNVIEGNSVVNANRGGWLGSNGGNIGNVQMSSENNANLATVSKGTVGVSQKGDVVVQTGKGTMFGDGADASGIKQSSGNQII